MTNLNPLYLEEAGVLMGGGKGTSLKQQWKLLQNRWRRSDNLSDFFGRDSRGKVAARKRGIHKSKTHANDTGGVSNIHPNSAYKREAAKGDYADIFADELEMLGKAARKGKGYTKKEVDKLNYLSRK